ncbi:clostripain-related cysteine peptidase [Prevotella sp. P6B4]|uniref:clostripain-related cysteine peptidase n=1 Tax=Prevotella sp. P6B4 TaxID=1410614 RepID=UPI00048C03E5|nr:clostripain-related cysteine peptidase [Prevotella sp. P6B4]
MNRFLLIIFSLVLVCSCSHNDDPDVPPVQQHTVLIYMSGENSLGDDSDGFPSYMECDLEELVEGSKKLADNQHLIAFIDSPNPNEYPSIVEIAGGTKRTIYSYNEDFYASNPAKFREVIDYVRAKYPSDDYGLVLWGHATGWLISTDSVASTRSYGIDSGNNTASDYGKWMNVTQMARALEGLPKLRFILADCCNFQCIESAYELRNTADYLIGSPAEIPGSGAPYDELVTCMFSQSSTFYKDMAECYYNYYQKAYQEDPDYTKKYNYLIGYSVPLSVVDLSKMQQLADATKTVLSTFMPDKPDEINLDGITYYYYSGKKVMYDMQAVIKRHAAASDYAAWLSVYNKAVPYVRYSQHWMTISSNIYRDFDSFEYADDMYGCVSMFIPRNDYASSNYRYNEHIRNLQWYYAVNWSAYGW